MYYCISRVIQGEFMSFDFNNNTPIYLQIIAYIKLQIISKKYLPKQKIPSVRELAIEFEVNPNTIQKALMTLENMGLIITERTNGKFVTDDEALIEVIKTQTIDTMVDEFYESMAKIGLNREQVLQILINERSKK